MPNHSTSNNLQLIISLCNSLTKSGVTPTVALIKKHANRPLPLPEIISVLKKWKLDPSEFEHIAKEPQQDLTTSELNTTDDAVKALEARIDKLEQQMAKLLQLQG